MASFQVLLMVAAVLVMVTHAQETAHADLDPAETKGRIHTRHIQSNNEPSQQRFRPRIRSGGSNGRGRSDSSENGRFNEDNQQYDPIHDGYVLISYGGNLGKGKKGQRYGNKYGSDYSVEYVGNLYGYEDDHGYNGGSFDGGFNTEQNNFKGSSGNGGGSDENTGSKGNSESTGGNHDDGGDAEGSDVTSIKEESEGSSGSVIAESADADGGGGLKGNSESMSDAAVSSGDAMGEEGSIGESLNEGAKGESMVDSIGGDTTVGEEGTVGETETMSEGTMAADDGTTGETGSIMEDLMQGDQVMGDMESMAEVSQGESKDAGVDETGGEGSNGASGSTGDGTDAGGDTEMSNVGESNSETGNPGSKGSAEATGSAEENQFLVEVEISEGDELEFDSSNKRSVLIEDLTSSESVAMTGKGSSVSMEKMMKPDGTTSSATVTSAMNDKDLSMVISDILKMAEMIKIDEMIKNGETEKIDEMLKKAEKIKPEDKNDNMPSSFVTTKTEKASPSGASGSTAISGKKTIVLNGNGHARTENQGNGAQKLMVASTNRVKQGSAHLRNSSGSSRKPPNSQVVGSPTSKPVVNNQVKRGAPSNISRVNGRPSGDPRKVSSVHERPATKGSITVGSKLTNSSMKSVEKEKNVPGNNVTLSATSKNVTSNTSASDGERRFLSIGKGGITFTNRGKQEKGAVSVKSIRSPFSAIGLGTIRSGNGEKIPTDQTKPAHSLKKPDQIMKPPSKPKANPIIGDTRPTFFTLSRFKGESTTEKSSTPNENGSKAPKNSVKEKRGISSSTASPENGKQVSVRSKGEKGSKGSDILSEDNEEKEIVNSTTESSAKNSENEEKGGSTESENGKKQNGGFVRNASPLSIVRYLRKGIGRYL